MALNDKEPAKKALREAVSNISFGNEGELIPRITNFLLANPTIIRNVGVLGDISETL